MTRYLNLTLILVSLFGCLSARAARGDILRVQKDASGAGNGTSWPNAYNELRDAMGIAQPFDEIWVAAADGDPAEPYYTPSSVQDPNQAFAMADYVGVYGGFLGTRHPTLPNGETQRSERDWESNVTVISGDLGSGIRSNVIVKAYGVNQFAIFDGFKITRATQHAIYCNNFASPTLENLLVTQNQGSFGVGMYNENSSSPSVTNCTFSANHATSDGGGMYNYTDSSPLVIDCIFVNNTAGFSGGGMYNDYSNPQVTGCTFQDNTATVYGGGGVLNAVSSATFRRCHFEGNKATYANEGGGGGVANIDGGNPKFVLCTFTGNRALSGGLGGAMYCAQYVTTTVINCVFTGNLAPGGKGGGVCIERATFSMVNSLFTGNSAGSGGGLSAPLKAVGEVANCTFSENTATSNGGGSSFGIDLGTFTLTNCILWNNSDAGGTDETAQVY